MHILSFKNPSLFRACISLADQTILNYLLGIPLVERALWEYFQILSKLSEHAENHLSTFFFFFWGGGFLNRIVQYFVYTKSFKPPIWNPLDGASTTYHWSQFLSVCPVDQDTMSFMIWPLGGVLTFTSALLFLLDTSVWMRHSRLSILSACS